MAYQQYFSWRRNLLALSVSYNDQKQGIPMPNLTMQERNHFLNTPGVLMRIGCVRSNGKPLVTPVWFIYQDDAIYFTPREKSAWFACLRDNPSVALCIDEEANPYRKVTLDGDVELIHDVGADDLWRDLYRAIAERYIPADAAEQYIQNTIDQPRGLFGLRMADAVIKTWRMPVQGEAQEGIWHDRYYGEGTRFKRKP
jgi:hypothetical protein